MTEGQVREWLSSMVDSGQWTGHTDWWQHERLKVSVHEIDGKILLMRGDGLHVPVPRKYSISGIEKALRYCPLCKAHDVDTYQFGESKRQACIPCRFDGIAEILVGEEVKDRIGTRVQLRHAVGEFKFIGKGKVYRVMATMAAYGRFNLECVRTGARLTADLHGTDGSRYDFHKTLDSGSQPAMYEPPVPDVDWKDKWRQVWKEKRVMHDGTELSC